MASTEQAGAGFQLLLPGRSCRMAVPGSRATLAAYPLFCLTTMDSATWGSCSHPALRRMQLWCPPPNPHALFPSARTQPRPELHLLPSILREVCAKGAVKGFCPAQERAVAYCSWGTVAHPASPQNSSLCRSPACVTITEPQGRAVPVVRDTVEALPGPELSLSALGLHMGPGSFS